ncbi:MAG: TonB-dependent receptor [Dysgonamonadaceae bacterium]|jgi:iron complex outermembrane receptor protein|nr:TonB-dependent receptor [Dysgonamonadaceae bacterium]
MKQNNLMKRKAFRFKRFVRKSYAAFNSMHKMVNIGVVAGCTLTFAASTGASAQSRTIASRQDSIAQSDLTVPERDLDEITVSATRAGLTLNQTAKIVAIISREEIERQAVESVQDLLKSVVGADVRQRGANGVLAGVAVRGGTFEQTAILLNGANITNPQTGHYNLDLPVNISDIERIEIIQGPTSLLYGAGAFSGGINIVTKKDSQSGVSVELEGGMHNLANANARAAFKTENSTHSVSAGYGSSDGYIENSEYQLFNALWQSAFQLNRTSGINLQLGIGDKEYGANTFYSAKYPDQYDYSRSLFASIKGTTGDKLKITPQVYWTRHFDHYELTKDSVSGRNFHRTDAIGANLNLQFRWAWGITNFGGEARNEAIKSSNLGKTPIENPDRYRYSDERTNLSAFVEHNILLDRFTLSLGLLANYNTAFKSDKHLYPNINAGYRILENWKIFASWTNATRMPTFTDLYYKGATHAGNSDVQPEHSESYELGTQYRNSFLTASLNGFYMKGIGLIDWVKKNPDDKWESRNLTDIDKTGFETNVSLRLGKFSSKLGDSRLNLGYMFLNQSKNAGDLISNYVMDYLRHKFTAGLSHPIYKGLTADWQFRWQDRAGTFTKYENPADKGHEEDYAPFALLDAKINLKLEDFNIYLKINNIFNTAYYDLGNIPQPGFWFMAGVKYAH